jgi:hypothetical protein
MSSVVSTAPGGEQITVKKTGGVGEVKRADPALKVNIEKDLEKEKLVELSSIQQAERMREEFELHKKLELEAEELAKLKEEQYLAEHSSAESLREAVEGLKLSELEFGTLWSTNLLFPPKLLISRGPCRETASRMS